LLLLAYFTKAKKKAWEYYPQGGEIACKQALASQPDYLRNNNGAASYLTIDRDNGLARHWEVLRGLERWYIAALQRTSLGNPGDDQLTVPWIFLTLIPKTSGRVEMRSFGGRKATESRRLSHVRIVEVSTFTAVQSSQLIV